MRERAEGQDSQPCRHCDHLCSSCSYAALQGGETVALYGRAAGLRSAVPRSQSPGQQSLQTFCSLPGSLDPGMPGPAPTGIIELSCRLGRARFQDGSDLFLALRHCPRDGIGADLVPSPGPCTGHWEVPLLPALWSPIGVGVSGVQGSSASVPLKLFCRCSSVISDVDMQGGCTGPCGCRLCVSFVTTADTSFL